MRASPDFASYSIAPASGGIWSNDVRSVRNRPISRSGLTPESTLRNSFMIRRSPKMTEVLLCSAPSNEGLSSSSPRSFLKERVRLTFSVPRIPLRCRRFVIMSSSASGNPASITASYSTPSSGPSGPETDSRAATA